ncbi:IclR family transcriptional regulator [Alsobacter sp. SYSU M60028]|uniref:IclR family transcriptional regulator n=1 Tax=Alsobacter ponti TaxID=2962936 RepID=A0ABT1LAG5_9HYPH|nr:IclR family transcriptional regulator [Alsobacter ponti]MCP8938449.1 IclR family transcriptional regulator [Alsobacter ponti]
MDENDGPYIVQPVMKALRVLRTVAEKGHGVTLTEVATELRMPKTTVFRYLQTLTAASFLTHDAARDRYGVGMRFRALASADKSLQRLRALAQPRMAELGRAFNETINLGVLSDGHIVYIDMVEANRALRMQARIGDRHPVHSTALGKAMLAFLPEAARGAYLDGALRERTIKTVTDRAVLKRQIEDVRRRGYSVEVGENEDGSMCIGVPVFGEDGAPLAAISLSAPERRMSKEVTARAAGALREAAAQISDELGGVGPNA